MLVHILHTADWYAKSSEDRDACVCTTRKKQTETQR